MLRKPEGSDLELYNLAQAWSTCSFPEDLKAYQSLLNPDFDYAFPGNSRWNVEVLAEAFPGVDFSPLCELGILRPRYTNDEVSSYYSPTVLHESFTSAEYEHLEEKETVRVYLEDGYQRVALADYRGVFTEFSASERGLTTVRIYHPSAVDVEHDRCLLAVIGIAGPQVSKHGCLSVEGFATKANFWKELPDYAQDSPPFSPGKNGVILQGPISILIS